MTSETRKALAAWLSAHRGVFKEIGWPPAEEETQTGFYGRLFARLVTNGFTEVDVLKEITGRMFEGERSFNLQDHINQIFVVGHAIYRERGRDPSGPAETIDELRRRSVECGLCHGRGLASVRIPADRRAPRLPDGTSPSYCVCPYGRKLAEVHRDRSPELYRQHVDLEAHPDLHGSIRNAEDEAMARRWAEAGLAWEEPEPGPCRPHEVRDAQAQGKYVADRRRELAAAGTPPPSPPERWADVRRRLGLPEPKYH